MNIIIYLFILFLYPQYLLANQPIALISKLWGSVDYNLTPSRGLPANNKVHKTIYDGENIKCGSESFVKIIYLDDGTSISLFSDTEILISGDIEDRKITKKIQLISGTLLIDVLNQDSIQFTMTTPYSKLSCVECSFWIISDKRNGDKYYKVKGHAFVSNSSVDMQMDLAYDSTVVATEDNKIEKFQSQVKEIKFLELLMQNADIQLMKTNLYPQTNPLIRKDSLKSNIVVIKLKNAVNVEREIIFTYTQ